MTTRGGRDTQINFPCPVFNGDIPYPGWFCLMDRPHFAGHQPFLYTLEMVGFDFLADTEMAVVQCKMKCHPAQGFGQNG